MEYKYTLPRHWVDETKFFNEFAMGGMQVNIKLKDGTVYEEAILSNCMHIIAMRGYQDLPFKVNDIVDIFQSEENKNQTRKKFATQGNIYFWDNWKK